MTPDPVCPPNRALRTAQRNAPWPWAHHGQPADIASAVAYLARPEARFVTGTTWDVDGGFAV